MEPIYQTGNDTVEPNSAYRQCDSSGLVPNHFKRHRKTIFDCHSNPV